MKDVKIQYVSTLRVVAMLMIVAFHSMLYYTGKWWVFDGPVIPFWVKLSTLFDCIDLPMFVFISGYLFAYLYKFKQKYRDKKRFVIGKIRRLLVPYLFWGLFLVYVMPPYNQLDNLLTGISHLWFLLMLFVVFLIVISISEFLFRRDTGMLWSLLFVSSCAVFCLFHAFSSHHHFLCIHSALFYLPAFILGMWFACSHIHHRISSEMAAKGLVGSLTVLGFYVFYCPRLPFYGDYVLMLAVGYAVVVSLFVLLSKKSRYGQKAEVVIAHFDKLSMGIYIFNQIIINAFLQMPGVSNWLTIHYYAGVSVIFLVGLVIPWLLSMMFNKVRWLNWTVG